MYAKVGKALPCKQTMIDTWLLPAVVQLDVARLTDGHKPRVCDVRLINPECLQHWQRPAANRLGKGRETFIPESLANYHTEQLDLRQRPVGKRLGEGGEAGVRDNIVLEV